MSEPRAAQVEEMFDRIAQRYDLLNTVLSGGSDARWRRTTARGAVRSPRNRILDIACGTGKLSVALQEEAPAGLVTGLDFSGGMLERARAVSPGPVYLRGDGLALPFGDAAFDATTMAFGLRNLVDPERGLREMARVVRAGGRMAVLEFVRPSATLLGRAYRLYLREALPRVGGVISGQPRAYRYLSDTVDAYRTPGELLELAAAAGWARTEIRLLTLGTVGLLTGVRGAAGR